MFFLKSPLLASGISTGLFLCCVLLFFPARGLSKTASSSQDLLDAGELVEKSNIVLRAFLQDPNMKWFRDNMSTVRGVFIVPQMLRGTFLIGSSEGTGLLFARSLTTGKWSYPGFYAIDSVSMGLQIGADAAEIILLIMTEQGMQAMLSSEFKIDSKVVVAAGPVGDGSLQHPADILSFARSMMGIISGVSLAGAVITPQSALNTAYYDRPVSLEDILLRQVVSNYKAESLRRRIATAAEEVSGARYEGYEGMKGRGRKVGRLPGEVTR